MCLPLGPGGGGGYMSENVVEKGPLDGPVFSAPQHVLEAGFGMENAQNQRIAQGGGAAAPPKAAWDPHCGRQHADDHGTPPRRGTYPRNSDQK